MKKLLALVLALVMSMSLVTISNADFNDADEIDYAEAVDVMNAVGVLAGYDNGDFGPKDTLTRAQACKIIAYLDLGQKTADAFIGTGTYFTDVAANAWYAGYVEYCAQAGYVSGVGGGKFAPDEKVTGYQFAKMLLCVLGYDAQIEKLNGADWQINTAKLAADNDIFDGIDVKGSVAYTREQAAKMAFNSLLATMVKYSSKGTIIEGNGITVTTEAAEASAVTGAAPKATAISDKTTTGGAYTVELGEKLYDGKLVKQTETKYGHENRYFTLDGKRVSASVATDTVLCTVNDVSDFTEYYTKGNKEYIGFENETAGAPAAPAVKLYLNGAAQNSGVAYTILSSLDSAIGATYEKTGVIFEFVDTNDNGKYDVVNVIKKSVYTLTGDAATKEVTNNDTQVKVPGVSGMGGFSAANTVENVFGYEGLKKGDVVLAYTSDGDTFIEKAAYVEGVVSGMKDGSKVVVDGTTYKTSGITNAGNTWSADYTNTYKFYLDNAGAIVKAEKVTDNAAKNYAYVLETKWNAAGALDTTNYAQARLLKTDGTSEVVTVSKVNGTKITTSNKDTLIADSPDGRTTFNLVADKFVTYKVSDGKYELTAKTTGTISSAVTGNKANFADSYVGNNATIFLVNTDAANDPEVKVYTGVTALPAVASTTQTGVYVDEGYAKYVYIQATSANISGAVADYVYIPGTGDNYDQLSYTYVPESADGKADDYYLFNAIVNGVAGELKLKTVANNVDTTGDTTADTGVAVNTLYKLVSTDSDSYVDLMTTSGVSSAITTGIAVESGVLKTSTSYKVDDDSIIYYIEEDGTVTEFFAKDYANDDDTDKVFVAETSDSGKIADVVYVFETISAVPAITDYTYTINGVDTKVVTSLTAGGTTSDTVTRLTVGDVVTVSKVSTVEGSWAISGTATVTADGTGTGTVTLTVTAEDGTTTENFTLKFANA